MENHRWNPIDSGPSSDPSLPILETSMSTLIIWNISKVVEKNPQIDLKRAIKEAQERLEQDSQDVNAIVSLSPECRHLACALLAWQQLGHNDTDSLYRFITTKQSDSQDSSGLFFKNKDNNLSVTTNESPRMKINFSKDSKRSTVFNTYSNIGPVVKLPVETKVIMRSDTPTAVYVCSQTPNRPRDKEILSKINKACCMESACVERLSKLDAATKQLRSRATKLAKREAERVQLLERAETAWRDLELGYQRRLTLAEEKEADLARQIKKVIEERNRLKTVCLSMTPQLTKLGDVAEKARERLMQVEKNVCERACNRLRLMEQAAKENAVFSEIQCQAAQQDRDLLFKEEQAQRKVVNLQNEVDSLRGLTYETERALRSELSALKDQVTQVSKQLLAEEECNVKIKVELEELRQEKMEIMEDLEGCKAMCDDRMQAKMDTIKQKKAQLQELEAVEMECRCKLPVDATVEVKRTPSLAALCSCTPEDKILDSCSCTSLRSRLLSTMLADLFGGLQVELGNVGANMPCQLLKCLEDKHNWDRASIVKSNLRNFFSKLLVGELDIAIASSIEKYHAKWVGASCADSAKMLPDLSDIEETGWEKRAIERQAQKLATELAEKMFEERAEQLAQRAKDIATARGPPPCECKPEKSSQALYSCTLQQRLAKVFGTPAPIASASPKSTVSTGSPQEWRFTTRDISLLRTEIEHLKKESIKKEDLKIMEQEIAKIVQLAASQDTEEESFLEENNKKDNKNRRNTNQTPKQNANQNKPNPVNKRQLAMNYAKNVNRASQHVNKSDKRPGQSYAVNLCLCDSKDPNKLIQQEKLQKFIMSKDSKVSWKQKQVEDLVPQVTSLKHNRPIKQLPDQESPNITDSKTSAQNSCKTDCACFHKIPSNTSIDDLLKTLEKFNCDLNGSLRKMPDKESSKPASPGATQLGDSIKDASTIDIQPSNHKIKQDSRSESNCSRVLSKKETAISNNLSCQIEENVTNVTEFERNLPTAAESEYMGAINLDKSNENFCKCIINHKIIADIPDKCITSCDCPMKYIESKHLLANSQLNVKNEIQTTKVKISHQTRNMKLRKKEIKAIERFQIRDQTISSLFKMNKPFQIDHQNKNSSFSVNPAIVNSFYSDKPTEVDTNTNNYSKDQALNSPDCDRLPRDRDYHIEFLGVTLNNAIYNDANIQDKTEETKLYSKNHSPLNKDLSSSKLSEMCVDVEKLQTYEPNIENDPCNQISKCQCNIKSDKLIIGNVPNKQGGDYNTNKDEAIDTQNLKQTNWNKEEPCVCCCVNNQEESNDLEVNTFHLLEEHLKEKLEDFKLSCTSLSIPPDEEGKLFSALVRKIKHVITESTSKVMCKCSEEYNSEGSWNRAYNLLQEYLKTKINRVQCICDSPAESKKAILPEVTNKVFSMIENDFQRLKDLYRCSNIENIKSVEQSKFQIPERDTTINVKDVSTSCGKSNTSIVLPLNISSQVTPNFGMETKSCDVIESSYQSLQRTDAVVHTDISIKSAEPTNHDRCSSFTKEFNKPCLVLGAENSDVNQVTNLPKGNSDNSYLQEDKADTTNSQFESRSPIEPVLSNIDEVNEIESSQTAALPYIGYTVNCSCNLSLGDCVCTKANVQENSIRIKNIWDTFTQNKPKNQNFSYIMDSISKKYSSLNVGEIREDSGVHSTTDDPRSNNNICDSKTSTHLNDCDFTLKESRIRNYKVVKNITTNTLDEDKVVLETDYSSVDDPLEWYECRSQSMDEKQVTKLKSVHFPLNSSVKSVKKEAYVDHHANLPRSFSGDCECNVVPICHVKMLMDNIEKKLVRSECTCDSLSSKVCPIHSQRNIS